MRSFAPAVMNVSSDYELSEPLRFLVQRFAELADPHVHFAASATFSLDPVTAVTEFVELARIYALSNAKNPSHIVMRSAVYRTRNILSHDANLKDWFGPERDKAIRALTDCIDEKTAAEKGVSKNKWLFAKTAEAGRGSVRGFRDIVRDPDTGYRSRLASLVLDQAHAPITAPSEWRSYDTNVRLLMGVLLSEGRDGVLTSAAVTASVRNAADTATAINGLRAIFDAEPEPYSVGFRLPGVKRPSHHPAFDCRRVRDVDPRWVVSASTPCDVDLAAFVAEAPASVVLATDVQAFDREHAYAVAMQRAERLVDQYIAEHRAYEFSVDPQMLVLDVGRQATTRVEPRRRTQIKPKALLKGPSPLVEQSLRYAALARGERVATVKVLHSWIALESLVRGSTTSSPYPFLRHHLPRLLALHAVRQSLSTVWHIAVKAGRKSSRKTRWDSVERWLRSSGPENRVADLNDWADLIAALPQSEPPAPPVPLLVGAPISEAATTAHYAMGGMTPFAVQSTLQWKFLLELGPRLSGWCWEMEARAKATVERMYSARNSAVHTALIEADGHTQLAHAAENIVDCVFEVLPQWLAAGRRPDEAIERLSRRSSHVIGTWGNRPRPPLINVQDLTRPGADGMMR